MMLKADNDFSNERIRNTTTNTTTIMLNMSNEECSMDCNLKTLHYLMLDIESSLCELILVDCRYNLNLILTTK